MTEAHQLSFRGWLPTVTGRLSFSVFGQTSHPAPAIYTNVADDECRFLCVYQERHSGDALIPESNKEYKFKYVFIASTTDEGLDSQKCLVGRAYIFSLKNWACVKTEVEGYRLNLLKIRDEVESTDELEVAKARIRRCESDILHFLNAAAEFHVGVNISRTGTTCIDYDRNLITSCRAPQLNNESRWVRNLSSQVFYFIKDIGHHHQHHDRHTDTVTDLYPYQDSTALDVKWRSDTLYSMYRKVIEYKRTPNKLQFNDCLGLLAYSETFRGISTEELDRRTSTAEPKASQQLPTYYYEYVSNSITATQSKIEREIETDEIREDKIRNILIAGVGILITYVGLMQFTAAGHDQNIISAPWLNWLLHFLLKKPTSILVPLLCALCYKPIGRVLHLKEFQIKFLRFFAPFRRNVTILALTTISVSGIIIITIIFFDFEGAPFYQVVYLFL